MTAISVITVLLYRGIYILYIHKKTKHEGMKYDCDQCDSSVTTQSYLGIHKQSKHDGVKYD